MGDLVVDGRVIPEGYSTGLCMQSDGRTSESFIWLIGILDFLPCREMSRSVIHLFHNVTDTNQ
jgi:hypothetical protein